MDVIVGVVVLGGIVFSVWTWFEALNVPRDRWTAVPCSTLCDKSGHWTKRSWFLLWYVGGFVTCGLVPVGMSIYFHQTLRPVFHGSTRAQEPEEPASQPAPEITSIGKQIDELHDLHSRGILTEEELDAKTTALLERTRSSILEPAASRARRSAPEAGDTLPSTTVSESSAVYATRDAAAVVAEQDVAPVWRWTGMARGWICISHKSGLCRECARVVAQPHRLGRRYGETVPPAPPSS
jgi:hypothetical protein